MYSYDPMCLPLQCRSSCVGSPTLGMPFSYQADKEQKRTQHSRCKLLLEQSNSTKRRQILRISFDKVTGAYTMPASTRWMFACAYQGQTDLRSMHGKFEAYLYGIVGDWNSNGKNKELAHDFLEISDLRAGGLFRDHSLPLWSSNGKEEYGTSQSSVKTHLQRMASGSWTRKFRSCKEPNIRS